jgi:AGCS family alanine or glycine:cation symporter
MQIFESIVESLNNLIWATPSAMPLMIVFLLGFGIFITLRLGFVQLRKFKHGIKVVMGHFDDPNETGDVNHFQALTTALSATVGIGNIAGVAIAIHNGGPGALFWMWITAFFGMAIKYSECTLAVMYRKQNPDGSVSGGPMYYIQQGLGNNWKWLAIAFATFAVICSFLTGNAVQANSVSDIMQASFSVPKWATGLISASVVGFVILGGIKRIGAVTARLAPLMALIYVLGALIILLMNYDQVIPSFVLIVKSAFNPTAGAYGVGSGVFLTTLVWGIKRGLFSNEAGQGSAPIAHAAAKTNEPVREGVVALLEPFIDTLVVCTMTGLVIITTNSWDAKHPQYFNVNSNEVTYVMPDGSSSLILEEGKILDGKIIKNNAEIDVIYLDETMSTTFTGTITKTETGYNVESSDGTEVSYFHANAIENGAPLTAVAFQKGLAPIMPGGDLIVTLCVILFAVSTSISWSYYGDRSIQFLAGDKSIIYYKGVYVVMHFVGAMLTLNTVWLIGDIALGLMTIPNIIALIALSGVVYKATQTYFSKIEHQ